MFTNINVQWAFVAVFGVLAVATLITAVLARNRTSSQVEESRQRIKSWWIMAILFAGALALGRSAAIVFFAFVSFLALKEYLTLVPTRRVDRTLLFFTYIAIPVQYMWVSMQWYGMFIIFIPVYMFLFLPIHMVIVGEPRGFIRSVSTLQWGLMITVFSLSHAAALLLLPGAEASRGVGAGLVLYLVLLTEFNDVFQFLWGKALGRRKIVPRVSPGKTWWGVVGGVLSTTVMSMLIAPYLTPMGNTGAFFAGIVIGVAGFFGDVTISSLKRDLHIKDTGRYIPGHGGVLDRVDSLTYTAPVFFHFMKYFFY